MGAILKDFLMPTISRRFCDLHYVGQLKVTRQSIDLSSLLREAIAEAKACGLGGGVDKLESTVGASYTTSSEWLGEIGVAVKSFLGTTKGKLPKTTESKLRACLGEVAKVWPAIKA